MRDKFATLAGIIVGVGVIALAIFGAVIQPQDEGSSTFTAQSRTNPAPPGDCGPASSPARGGSSGSTPASPPIWSGLGWTPGGYVKSTDLEGCAFATYFNIDKRAMKKRGVTLTKADAAALWNCLLKAGSISEHGNGVGVPGSLGGERKAARCKRDIDAAAAARDAATASALLAQSGGVPAIAFGNDGWNPCAFLNNASGNKVFGYIIIRLSANQSGPGHIMEVVGVSRTRVGPCERDWTVQIQVADPRNPEEVRTMLVDPRGFSQFGGHAVRITSWGTVK